MSRQLGELEAILQQQISEHHKLLKHLGAHQTAMRNLDLRGIDEATKAQECSRLRLANLEARRQTLVKQIALSLRLSGLPTLAQLAAAMPQGGGRLLELRRQLRSVMEQVAGRATVVGKLAGAVLGHLNTVVRLVAGAVEQAGLYTKEGVPRVSARIGVLEAVG